MQHWTELSTPLTVGAPAAGVSHHPGIATPWEGQYLGQGFTLTTEDGVELTTEDTEPHHWFRDGTIAGTPQKFFGFPVSRVR